MVLKLPPSPNIDYQYWGREGDTAFFFNCYLNSVRASAQQQITISGLTASPAFAPSLLKPLKQGPVLKQGGRDPAL